MKILDYSNGMLLNQEVYELVKIRKSERMESSKLKMEYAERNWLDTKVCQYLQPLDYPVTADQIQSFTQALAEHHFDDIKKEELVQMMNLHPNQAVDMHVILENCSDRYSDEQVDTLVDLVQQFCFH